MKSAQLHKWHRRVGITVIVFITLLSCTGLMLNHTEKLSMSKIYIQGEWLLSWYDIRPNQPTTAFKLDGDWISRVGNRIYFNNRELSEQSDTLIGAIKLNGIIVVALKDHLLLLTKEGELIEKLSGLEGVPAGMSAIGVMGTDRLVIKAAHGYYLTDIEALEWEEHKNIQANWSVVAELPQETYEQLLQLYRGKGLSLERIILDLHSGRFLGTLGVYLVDIAALLFLFLAITGAWMWLKLIKLKS